MMEQWNDVQEKRGSDSEHRNQDKMVLEPIFEKDFLFSKATLTRFRTKVLSGGCHRKLVMVACCHPMDKDEDGKGRPGFAHAFLAENASADTTNGILQRLGVPRMEWL